ncbi:MAG: hypothetical protein HY791_17375 [Deltaproteobacteria bacterium]|nr:hypothetical protein [Deltaproteobacteria bacterium]
MGDADDSNSGLRLERGGTEAQTAGDADPKNDANGMGGMGGFGRPGDQKPCGLDPSHEACWAACAEDTGLNVCGEAAAEACNSAFRDAEQKLAAEQACIQAREACADQAAACEQTCPAPPPDPNCAPKPDWGCGPGSDVPPSPECHDAIRSFDECNLGLDGDCGDERQALDECVRPALEQCESAKRSVEECWMTMGDCAELEQAARDACTQLEECRSFEEALKACYSPCAPFADRIAETCPPKPCEPMPPPCDHGPGCQPMPPSPECEAAVHELEACKLNSDQDCQDEILAADECMRPLATACEATEQALKSCFESGMSDCSAEREAAEACYQSIAEACDAERDAVGACFEACREMGDRVQMLCAQPCQPPPPERCDRGGRTPDGHPCQPDECDPNGMSPDGRPCRPPPPPEHCDPNGLTPDGRPCQPPPHECDQDGMSPDGRPCRPPPPERCDQNGVTPDGQPCQPPPCDPMNANADGTCGPAGPSPECLAAIHEVEACHAQQSQACAAQSAELEECVRPVLQACEQVRMAYGECLATQNDCSDYEEQMQACFHGMEACRPFEEALVSCMEPCREAAERADSTCHRTPWPEGPRG